MLTTTITENMKKDCEGCQNNMPSQLDHACLIEPASLASRSIDKLYDEINVFQFIVLLSQKAADRNVVVKRPYETFLILKATKEDHIKTNVLKKFHY